MDKSRWQPMFLKRDLEAAQASGTIVRLYRSGLEDGWADGFIAGTGPEFFALEFIDTSIRPNGFNCMRYADVTECVSPAPHDQFIRKALAARSLERSKDLPVDLTSLASLLISASAAFPLVTIHLEKDDDVCFIGKVAKSGDGKVELLCITPDARWEDVPKDFDLSEITRVDFGGSYEEALHLASIAN